MESQAAPAPDFFLGSIPVYGRLILAPMDGLSDPTFRWITRKLGSAYSVSEFINTLDYTVMRHFQENRLLFREQERPFGFQLLDNDPCRMANAAVRLMEEFKADFFDINIGQTSINRKKARSVVQNHCSSKTSHPTNPRHSSKCDSPDIA